MIDTRNRFWSIVTFCTLCFLSALIVMVLYHTILRFPKESESFQLHNQPNNQLNTIIDETEVGCEYSSIVGDDICDDIANTKICAYDFGDCCSFESDRSLCQNCTCKIELKSNNTYLEKACLESSTKIEDHLVLALLGNGKCQLDFNNKNYDFDSGDCCIDDPKCFVPSIPGKQGKHIPLFNSKY